MDDLVQFLRDRLDEDEQTARAAGDSWYGYDPEQQIAFVPPEDSRHIARHDPARVLAEVEAKRRIVDAHGCDHECISLTDSGDTSVVDGKPWALWELEHTGDAETPCLVLRCLALPYVDHPDYRDDWRP